MVNAVGPANDEVLRVITKAGAQTIAAWGGHGRLRGRSAQVGPLLDSPMCLGATRRGEPRHPLYIPADTQLVPWLPLRSAFDSQGEEWTADLFQAPAAAVKRLRAAIAVVKGLSESCRPAVRWSLPRGDGSAADPLVLSYPQYDEGVTQLIAALDEVSAQPVFDWIG